jgi:ribosomal protein S18 acetylase RimI-like enzyme
MFNAHRFENVGDLLHIWEDAGGEIAAWGLVYPEKHPGFDLQVRPDLRDVDFETQLVEYLTSEAVRSSSDRTEDDVPLSADISAGDAVRAEALRRNGFARGGDAYFLTAREIGSPPPVGLPPGYVIRAAVGPDDAAALAAVHSGSFGSTWTAETYEWLMTTPGYAPERELVAVAPDGSFAAFTVTWYDHVNRTGLFEPVGTHVDHRRLGLGRAVLSAGMQRMHKAGLATAMVVHEADNEGSTALYADAGFRPIARLDVWTRPQEGS